MAKLNNAFDSNQHDDMANFDPIPPGVYPMMVTDSDVLQTKDKKGKYIKLELTVINGEFKGRKVWTNLNIVNQSAQAVEIAQKELATICRACGKPVIQDTNELHGIPMSVKIRIKPASGDYPPSNTPSGYEPLGIKGKSKKSEDSEIDQQPAKKSKQTTKKQVEVEVEEGDDIPWGDEE